MRYERSIAAPADVFFDFRSGLGRFKLDGRTLYRNLIPQYGVEEPATKWEDFGAVGRGALREEDDRHAATEGTRHGSVDDGVRVAPAAAPDVNRACSGGQPAEHR